MGFNAGLSSITSGGLIITALFLVFMGIVITGARNKVRQNAQYNQRQSLQSAECRLTTAYILAFIAAGIIFLLAVIYAGQGVYWNPSEWIHMFFFFVALVLVVIAMIYVYLSLEEIYSPDYETNGADTYVWSSLFLGLFSVVFILLSMATRIGYNVAKNRVTKQWTKLKQTFNDEGSDVIQKVENFALQMNDPDFDTLGELRDIRSSLSQTFENRGVQNLAPPVSQSPVSQQPRSQSFF